MSNQRRNNLEYVEDLDGDSLSWTRIGTLPLADVTPGDAVSQLVTVFIVHDVLQLQPHPGLVVLVDTFPINLQQDEFESSNVIDKITL